MVVRIVSNFVIPGLEGESLDVAEGITLRQLLVEISRISEKRLEFFRRGSETLDSEDWEVDINGVPYYAHTTQLETLLTDGDLVGIRISIIGGG
jgi:hypothetical protein